MTLLPNDLHLVELLGSEHGSDHLLAHLEVGSDAHRALRYSIIGQLSIPKRSSVVILILST